MSEVMERPADAGHGQPMEVVERDGVTYTLLGTAHVSKASADAVTEIVGAGAYDLIAVELCGSRYAAMTNPDAWKELDLFQVIREGKGGLVAANLALSAYQRRLAEQFGIEPGAEMRAALDAADERGVDHALIDRDVGITFKRMFRKVGFFEKFSLFSGLIYGLFSREEITEEDIEKLKQGDMLESTFSEFAAQSQSLYTSLIADRDVFMADRLREDAGAKGSKNVLAVIGAGHLAGITRELKETQAEPGTMQAQLNEVPPRGWFSRSLPWLITIAVLSGFLIGFLRSPELGLELVLTWILVNGLLAAVGATIAGGHPLTIASAFVAAPLTSLNPTVAAGMVTASVETLLRKPTVGDFTRLRDDVIKLSGWWRNRVSRILLVLVFSNIGSMLGTWIAGLRIVERLT